jgi:hypothetical protein
VNKRHPFNPNLHLHYDRYWCGSPVLTQKGPLVVEYLRRIDDVFWAATNDHPRSLMIRVDPRLPQVGEFQAERFMPRFLASLNAQIEADLKRKARKGGRVHPCRLRYVWAREQNTSLNPHFHSLIFLNRDAYHCLGDFRADDGNMAARIKKAMASALNIPVEYAAGLAHFPDGGVHVLDTNAGDFQYRRAAAFECASYLAKAYSKYYGNHARHFGYSRG